MAGRQPNFPPSLFRPIEEFDVDESEDSIALLDDDSEVENTVSVVGTAPNHLLLVALLEHLCNLYIKDSTKSNQLFKVLCGQLSRMKILSPFGGFDELSSLRSQYRLRFSRLVEAAISVINQPDIGVTLKQDIQDAAQMFMQPRLSGRSPTISLAQVMGFHTSRYREEFRELCALGKGAYGCVFKALHKLDSTEYAVKKISFREVDPEVWLKVLREVKYLAKINHRSVVRYHGAWLEYSSPYPSVDDGLYSKRSPLGIGNGLPSITFKEDSTGSQSGARKEEQDDSLSVVFEASQSVKPSPSVLAVPLDGGKPDVSRSSGAGIDSWNKSHPAMRDLEEENYFMPKAVVILHIQMELCEQTLKEWLHSRNARPAKTNDVYSVVDEAENLRILQQVLKAVEHIHHHDIIHRDLKPKNIFLCSTEKSHVEVKLGDFGLARNVDVPDVPLTPHPGRMAGSSVGSNVFYTSGVGTTIYAAPEQLQGSAYDNKSDMYSLGLVLFELYQPFKTEMERFHTLTQLRKGSMPAEFMPRWPKQAILVKQLTHLNPDCRPSATHLLHSELFLTKDQVIERLHDNVQEQTALTSDLQCQLKVKTVELEKMAKEHKQQLQDKDREIARLQLLLMEATLVKQAEPPETPV